MCQRHREVPEGWQWVDAVVTRIVPPQPMVRLTGDCGGFYRDIVQIMAEQRVALSMKERSSLLGLTNPY